MVIQLESRAPVEPAFETDDERWTAVVDRDKRADSTFYYSVRTTGVFCRPSCGARVPLRENVQFHSSLADATAAGFRPCKRCRPGEQSVSELQAEAIARACSLMEDTDVLPSVDELAAKAGMSRFHFQRVFKSVTGLTPKSYMTAHRAQRVRRNVDVSDSVTDAIYDSGFSSSGPFYAVTSSSLGMTPSEFRSGAAGVQIRYSIGESSVGLVLVAATDRGVCAILLGDERDALIADMEAQFPHAEINSDPAFDETVAAVIRFVEEPALGLSLPLDVRGTAFQHRVWQALRKIPAGTTATYAEVAEMIGAPGASRAVSGACAANPVAIAVPCHRVVRKDGELAGYRWGVERKRALLERESEPSA